MYMSRLANWLDNGEREVLSMMVKRGQLLSLLLFITLSLVGCGNNDEKASAKVAEDFGKTFYTVDSNKTSQFDDFSNSLSKMAESQRDNITSTGVIELKDTDTTVPAFDENIRPLMTEDAYKKYVANRHNIMNIQACKKNDVIMQVTDFTLTKTFYDSKQGKIGFDYEVKLKITSNKDKDTQTDNGKGNIGLIRENGQWKVYSSTISVMPKLIRE